MKVAHCVVVVQLNATKKIINSPEKKILHICSDDSKQELGTTEADEHPLTCGQMYWT